MEKLLTELFGLQFFVGDGELQALIDDTESRYGEDISEEALGFLAAAGEPTKLLPFLRPGELDP